MHTLINELMDHAYENYKLSQSPSEFKKFCEFYYSLRCKNVLEIGSYCGGTFYMLCKLGHPTGTKISLDYPVYDNQIFDESYQRFLGNAPSFADNVHVLIGDSHQEVTVQNVERILGEKKLDFLFIDGDHTYQGVKMDYEMYKHFVKPGGYIAFHDIGNSYWHRQFNCEVDKLWNELPAGNKLTFNLSGYMGIGVVQV